MLTFHKPTSDQVSKDEQIQLLLSKYIDDLRACAML